MELLANPFLALGATMRDNRRRIMDLAEAKSLISDEGVVRESTAVLTNPRRRLAAEIGWLPGLGPKRISEAISVLEQEPAKIRDLGNVPSLARANLLADGLIRVIGELPEIDVARWIIELAEAHEDIKAEQTVTFLNEERSVAGFPAVSDPRVVDQELQDRRQYYKQAIKRALDQLPAPSCAEVVAIAVDEATDGGDSHAPILIHDLADSFAVEAQTFLDEEKRNIETLVEGVRRAVSQDEGHEEVGRLVSQLEEVVRNWDRVAQPIQLSARSQGTSHDLSHEVAGGIRSLAVELLNQHGLLDISKRLTALQQDVFAEVDRIVEQAEEDATKLDEIAERRSQLFAEMKARAKEWEREITYEADVGIVFKERLRISPNGVQWKRLKIPLEEITRVRWGGTEHSVNGIPTGTTYNIFVAGERCGTTIKLRDQQIYSAFVDRLWKSAGERLLTEMLEGLRSGNRYRFGAIVVADYGVELERRKLFSANQRVACRWTDLVIGNGVGTFYLAKSDERKVTVELPYQEIDNVHVLEAAIRIFWKNASLRLSDLLDEAD